MSAKMWMGLMAAGAVACRAATMRGRRISFRGRTVVITGGSRGLGLVMARQWAAEGAHLALLARDDEELHRAVMDVAARGANVLGVPCDLRSQQAVHAAVERVLDRFGRIDVLVNNAGAIQVGPFDHMSMADFEDELAVHFWGPLYAMTAVLRHMRIRGEGRIVNISSIGGMVGVPHLVPYCASKFALTGLSDALRAELTEDNIFVSTVCPGLMRTGSPGNAMFKGRHREEFTWFALMDANPLVSVSAQSAARAVIRAARYGRERVVIGLPAKLAVFLNAVAPGCVGQAMALVNRFVLPDVSLLHDKESYTGWQSRSSLAPSVLTRLNDQAAAENNELRNGNGNGSH